MLTVRELLQRLLKPGKTEELAEAMLSQLSSDLFEKNSLRFNLPMLVVRFLFMSAILLPHSHISRVKEATIHSLHSTLKAQVTVADAFRKGFG